MNSMTGYGRSRQVLDGREITVEIRSVNHRYLEYSARIPRMYGYLEEKLKTFLQSSVSRGKVEVTVTIQNLTGGDTVVQINQALAKGYLDAMRSQAESLGLKDDLTLSTLTRFNDVFTLQKLEEDQQVIWNSVQQVARQALDQFLEMRRREGERLKLDLLQKLELLNGHVAAVEEQSPKIRGGLPGAAAPKDGGAAGGPLHRPAEDFVGSWAVRRKNRRG